jgi:hypothetical protein
MKAIRPITSLVIICFTAQCLAGDAEDAVDILTNAFKCPLPVIYPKITSVITSFRGNRRLYRTVTQVADLGSSITTTTVSAAFSELSGIKDYSYLNTPDSNALDIVCTAKRNCISYHEHITYMNSSHQDNLAEAKSSQNVRFCDKEAVGYAKLAIEALIKLNK